MLVHITEAPKLNLSGLKGKKIKVRAGETIYVKIPLSGAPVPTIDWTRNNSKLPDSNRIHVRVWFMLIPFTSYNSNSV
jgi:hypothetical protein